MLKIFSKVYHQFDLVRTGTLHPQLRPAIKALWRGDQGTFSGSFVDCYAALKSAGPVSLSRLADQEKMLLFFIKEGVRFPEMRPLCKQGARCVCSAIQKGMKSKVSRTAEECVTAKRLLKSCLSIASKVLAPSAARENPQESVKVLLGMAAHADAKHKDLFLSCALDIACSVPKNDPTKVTLVQQIKKVAPTGSLAHGRADLIMRRSFQKRLQKTHGR